MNNINLQRRNPRYLSIPTLLAALVFAHLVHVIVEPFGLHTLVSAGLYLVSLAVPIILKRTFSYDPNYDIDPFDPVGVSRLPTSRFRTVPNEDALD